MNKALWDEFVNGKAAINCRTENQAKKFLRICEEKGLKWRSGWNATKTTLWETYKDSTCYHADESGLAHGDIECYKNEWHLKVITFKQLMKSDKPKEDRQEQKEYTFKEVIARITENEEYVCMKECYNIKSILKENEGITINYTNKDLTSVAIADDIKFILKAPEKHYLTFDEARRTGKKFGYKGWKDYVSLAEFMSTRWINKMDKGLNDWLDERAWEVEE